MTDGPPRNNGKRAGKGKPPVEHQFKAGNPGRPTIFKQETADVICDRLADGESLRAICLSETMPARSTIFKWLGANTEFADQYARAREAQADAIFDDILTIADTMQIGKKVKKMPGGKLETVTGDMIEHRRLQVDARKWMAGKLRPKKYGDKIDVEQRTTLEAGDSISALMRAIDGQSRTK